MKFTLKKEDYEYLQKMVPEVIKRMQHINGEDIIHFDVPEQDVIEMQSGIDDKIVEKGMDDQDTVNEIGIRLYSIYDELLYQKHSQLK